MVKRQKGKGKGAPESAGTEMTQRTASQPPAASAYDQAAAVAQQKAKDAMQNLEDDDSAAALTSKILLAAVIFIGLLCLLGVTVIIESSVKVHVARSVQMEADQVADTLRLSGATIGELRAAVLVAASPTQVNIAYWTSAMEETRLYYNALPHTPTLESSWNKVEASRRKLGSQTVENLITVFRPFLELVAQQTIDLSQSIFVGNRQRVVAGLSCVLTELLPHVDSFVIGSWSNVPPGVDEESLYRMMLAVHSHFSVCTKRFLPNSMLGALHPDNVVQLTIPTGLATFNTTPGFSMSAEDAAHAYDRRIDAVRQIMTVSADHIHTAAAGSLDDAQTPLILAVFLTLSCIVSLIVCIILSKNILNVTAKLSTDRVYSTLDDRPESMRRYVEIVQSVTLRPGDSSLGGEIVGATNLGNILLFVKSLRPFLMQSSLGELESITISGSQITSKGVAAGSNRGNTTEEQSLQEIQMRELRTEVGLQTVLGTVMAIQLSPLCTAAGNSLQGTESNLSMSMNRELKSLFGSDAPNDFNRWVQESLKKMVHLINACGGVVHSFNGDTIIALWNVCGATDGPCNAAVDCALKIHSTWSAGGFTRSLATMNSAHADHPRLDGKKLSTVERPSIGIAQSLLVAGNIETMSLRNQLVVAGPAMMKAGMAVRACAPLGCSIVVDSTVAEQYSPLTGSMLDHCIREGAYIHTGLNDEEKELFFVVHRHRYKAERILLWRGVFQEIMKLNDAPRGQLAEDKKQVVEMLNKFKQGANVIEFTTQGKSNLLGSSAGAQNETTGATQQASSVEASYLQNDPVAAFWLRSLRHQLQSMGM